MVFPLPTATISGGDTLCGEGNSTILTVNLTGTPPWSFYYSNGTTTWLIPAQYTTPFTIVASEPGVYTVLTISDKYCSGTPSGSAVVVVSTIPPTPVISITGTELLSSGCCGNQWYKEGILIPGETGQVFVPQASAHYFNIVTLNGCSSDTSNVIYYFMTGIRQYSSNNFSMEPNPAKNFTTVRSKTGAPSVQEITIYAVTGKKEATYLWNPLNDKNDMLIDIQCLSPGLYFLSIGTKSEKTVLKLIVQ